MLAKVFACSIGNPDATIPREVLKTTQERSNGKTM